MTNPFRYRPKWEEQQVHYVPEGAYPVDAIPSPIPPDGEIDWENNWLSNALAWASDATGLSNIRLLHLVANPFWTDCPTCLFWRGAMVGAIFAATIAALI